MTSPVEAAILALLGAEDETDRRRGVARLLEPEGRRLREGFLRDVRIDTMGRLSVLSHLGHWRQLKQAPQIQVAVALLRRFAPDRLREIERVRVYGRQIVDLSFLRGLPALERLWILDAGRLTTLATLERLDALTHLYVARCRRLVDLRALARLPALRSVRIFHCPKLRDLSPLAGPPRLEEILLEGCGSQDLAPLTKARSLRKLELINTSFPDPAPLREMPALAESAQIDSDGELHIKRNIAAIYAPGEHLRRARFLSLRGRWELRDLSPIAGAPHLEGLDLRNCRGLRSIWPLLALERLSFLDLRGCALPVPLGYPMLEDRQQVDSYQRALAGALAARDAPTPDEARWLEIARAAGLLQPDAPTPAERARRETISRIRSLLRARDRAMARQGIALAEALGDAELVERLSWGLWLDDNGAPRILARWRSPFKPSRRTWAALALLRLSGGLARAERVQVGDRARLEDLDLFAGLSALRELELHDATELRDLRPLAGCAGLERLRLDSAEQITDLSPLAGLTRLRELTLSGAHRIADLSPLAGLTALERLDLRGCRSLPPVWWRELDDPHLIRAMLRTPDAEPRDRSQA